MNFIGKDRDSLIRDPLCLSLLRLIKAILSLTDSYIGLLSLTKAICQRVSKWGSLSFPMIYVYVCMCVCMHACMRACMHVCMYACIYVSMYLCTHVRTFVGTYVCAYLCIHVCV